jgi:benzoyl-CoA reductase subunit BamB
MKCGATISVPGISTYMMKCFSKLTYTMGAYSNLEFGLRFAQKATEHGLDAFSAPQTMAFAIELYEAGILTDADMPGFPPDGEGRFYWLLDRIVRRQGIGDVLADGTWWAARRIGKGAEAYAHNTIRRTEQLPLKLGMLNPIYFLMYCTGEKATSPRSRATFPRRPLPRGRSARPSPRTGLTSPMSGSRSGSRTGSFAARTRSQTTRSPGRAARS